jgi:ferrochelatase
MSYNKNALLIINLGTPDSPSPASVGRYLREFLSDKNVIDINPILRFLLVNFIIVPFRKGKSAMAYQKIWNEDGSPLLLKTRALTSKIQDLLVDSFEVKMAMRYGKPGISEALQELSHYETIHVLPLYPQETKSSYGTAKEEVRNCASKLGLKNKIVFVPPFYDQDFYIDSLAEKIKSETNEVDHYLFSYHGIPVSHHDCCERMDGSCQTNNCYRTQCFKTTELVAKTLELKDGSFSTSFQSRLGRQEWIKPYTDHHLLELKEKGVNSIAVISPSFIVDCLETLEEIDMEYRGIFESNENFKFSYISCLNDQHYFIDRLSQYLKNTSDSGLTC